MAKETKAQRLEREANDQAQLVAVAKATYTFRLMQVLERAVKENFELKVLNCMFQLKDRDGGLYSSYMLYPEWSDVSDTALYELEMAVELKEEERAEREQKANVRAGALAKLTAEERTALGL
jgi:hypothetical protein